MREILDKLIGSEIVIYFSGGMIGGILKSTDDFDNIKILSTRQNPANGADVKVNCIVAIGSINGIEYAYMKD